MFIKEKISAALKGGTFLGQYGRYWQGVTFITGGDRVKAYDLFNELPFAQAKFTGGLVVTTESAWAQQVGEAQHNFTSRIPLFKEDKETFYVIDKKHIEKVLSCYLYLCGLRKELDPYRGNDADNNIPLLLAFIELMPNDFNAHKNEVFSYEWFLKMLDIIPEGGKKDELKDLFLNSGVDLVNVEKEKSAEHQKWLWFQSDLIELSKIFVNTNITTEVLKNHATACPTVLVVPEGGGDYLRAVVAYYICETIELIQVSLRERKFDKSSFAVREHYPVCIDTQHNDCLKRFGILAHAAKCSHMAIFMTIHDLQKLRKKDAGTLLSSGYRLFDTSLFPGKKGAYGYSPNGSNEKLEKVFIN